MPLSAMIASTVVPFASAIAARLSPSSISTGAIVCQLVRSSVAAGASTGVELTTVVASAVSAASPPPSTAGATSATISSAKPTGIISV